MLKLHALREMTREELEQKRRELAEEQFNLRMRKSLKSLDNPLRLRQIRREVAKVLTVLNEDKLGIRKLADTSTSILSQARARRDEADRKGDS